MNEKVKDLFAVLTTRHKFLKEIRGFFDSNDYIEVDTPIRVQCPGFDEYIDAISTDDGFYLATSPELQMKRLLSKDVKAIYQITHAFRAEEKGGLHNPEFAMLEWYRTDANYQDIMNEAEYLLKHLLHEFDIAEYSVNFPVKRITADDAFLKCAGWKPSVSWDEDRYFLDWIEKVEPFLANFDAVFITDFPAELAALSKIKEETPLLCERFELFIKGIEIGNAFSELTDYDEHLCRFEYVKEKRIKLGKPVYPLNERFLSYVRESMPPCAGMALGLDRLIMVMSGLESISQVNPFFMDY